MWILLDENVPVDLPAVLRAAGHEAESANYLGWKGLKNGEILGRAASRYDLLLTRDGDFDETLLRKRVDSSFGIVLLAIPQQRVRKAVENALASSSVSQNQLGCRFFLVRCFHSQRCQLLTAIEIFGVDSETFAATRFRGLRLACSASPATCGRARTRCARRATSGSSAWSGC
jgi:predicted nuclease of predicted toxin-antitoxin system